jgi:hypothetical protein
MGMEANSLRMILDIGLTPNPEELSLLKQSRWTRMMIFINS